MRRLVLVIMVVFGPLALGSASAAQNSEQATGQNLPVISELSANCNNIAIDIAFVSNTLFPVAEDDVAPLPGCSQDGTLAAVGGVCGTTSFMVLGSAQTAPTTKTGITLTVTCWPTSNTILPGLIETRSPIECNGVIFDVQVTEHPLMPGVGEAQSVTTSEIACPE